MICCCSMAGTKACENCHNKNLEYNEYNISLDKELKLFEIFKNKNSSNESGINYCPHCGYKISSNDNFCRICGWFLK